MLSESSVGESSVFVGRQSVISDRSGLCKIVSRVGAIESMVIMCPSSSVVRFGVVGGTVDGWGGVWWSVRRWRRSMDLLRSVVMSLLTVLGHNLLRCLCVGREYGVLAGKFCVATVRPSARMSCMASAAAMSCWRVLSLYLWAFCMCVGVGCVECGEEIFDLSLDDWCV